jgi:hypothetical protein
MRQRPYHGQLFVMPFQNRGGDRHLTGKQLREMAEASVTPWADVSYAGHYDLCGRGSACGNRLANGSRRTTAGIRRCSFLAAGQTDTMLRTAPQVPDRRRIG